MTTVLFAVFVVTGSAGPLCAQQQLPPPQDLSIQELVNQCAGLLGSERYAEAIPYIKAFIKALELSSADENKRALEKALLSLAVAYLETEDAAKAEEVLNEFLAQFPQSGQRRAALLLKVEAQATVEDWEGVVTAAREVLQEPGLTPRELLLLNQSLGEALFILEKWEPAIEPLRHVFHRGQDQEIRNEAAAMATICLVRSGRFDALFEFLPQVFATAARYDARLALTLMESGDENYDNGGYREALLLYRLVYSKAEIEAQIDRQIVRTKEARERVTTMPGLDRTRRTAMRRQLDRQVMRLELEKKDLAEVKEYVQQLTVRLARTYLTLNRYWEAYLLFHSIYEEDPTHELAEQSLYSAFSTAQQMGNIERTISEGRLYMEAYPGGEFWDVVTLTLALLHLEREEWREGIAVAQKAIEVNPDHTNYDQMLYLMGFAHFQLEEFRLAQKQFTEIWTRFPSSFFLEQARYWHAACHLFLADYRPARSEFEAFVKQFEDGQLYEDAFYRTGVAQYGDNDFDASALTLERFVKKFPDSVFAPEAHSMLGDIYASRGQLDEAIAAFTQAIAKAQEMIQINYATFQVAKVYELEQRYDEIIALFRDYLTKYPTEGNFTEATYWVGNAQMEQGDRDAALETFFDAIVKYGDEPAHHGIDMILRDLIYEATEARFSDENRKIYDRLYEELRRSRTANRRTLELRLVTMFAEITDDENHRRVLVDSLLKEKDLDLVAPLTLDLMGREALARNQAPRAHEVFEYLLANHAESELVLSALTELAELRIEAKQYDEALLLLGEITSRFATTPMAGEATARRADVLRLLGRCDEAVELYTSILAVREWRGELWPESLFGIGECLREQGEVEKAFAYYQRVYVLYEGYVEWAARAYIQSAVCLEKMGQADKAVATYREMLSKDTFATVPESNQARDALNRLGGGT